VLEHLPDKQIALENAHAALETRGRAVILVPQHPGLYGSLDVALEHRERYTTQKLQAALERSGFRVERIFDFNRASVPAWYLNGEFEVERLLANSIENLRVGHAGRPEAGSALSALVSRFERGVISGDYLGVQFGCLGETFCRYTPIIRTDSFI
jgi:hypothetical protein